MAMLKFVLLATLLSQESEIVSSASITGALKAGVCLCVTEPNVPALSDPFQSGSVVSTLGTEQCFITEGSIVHLGGNTFYQLRDDHNRQTAWVDSFYLSIADQSTCGSTVTTSVYHIPSGAPDSCQLYHSTWQHGQQFMIHGIQCTCDDGAALCSWTDKQCLQDGIVYPSGSTFTLSGRGSCSCQQGIITCSNGAPVGK